MSIYKQEMITFTVITISDSASNGERIDLSGPALVNEILQNKWNVGYQKIIPDDLEIIQKLLRSICQKESADIIITTGGTGFSKRDVTPEATRKVIEKETPGIVELIRSESYKTNPHAMLSRSIAGICKNTLIINLPGSPKGAVESFRIILPLLPHAINLIKGVSTDHQHKI